MLCHCVTLKGEHFFFSCWCTIEHNGVVLVSVYDGTCSMHNTVMHRFVLCVCVCVCLWNLLAAMYTNNSQPTTSFAVRIHAFKIQTNKTCMKTTVKTSPTILYTQATPATHKITLYMYILPLVSSLVYLSPSLLSVCWPLRLPLLFPLACRSCPSSQELGRDLSVAHTEWER